MRERTETPEQKEARLSAFERDMRPITKPAFAVPGWQLHVVDDIEFTPDNSGHYVLINWDLQTESVRLDIMANSFGCSSLPIMSFRGKAENVRKHTMKFLSDNEIPVSLEHASYIGREIERSDNERIDYVQD